MRDHQTDISDRATRRDRASHQQTGHYEHHDPHAPDFNTEIDPALPDTIHTDAKRLQQVLKNLLSNALKFTDPGGTIDVRLAMNGRFARIVVSDTGHGISPDFLPHVFERFRQADHSSSRRHGAMPDFATSRKRR